MSAQFLVMDDLGADRLTDFALEGLYLMIDRWYRRQKKGLVITSNFDLGRIAESVDDRIASRIAGMCEVIHMTGEDRRISR